MKSIYKNTIIPKNNNDVTDDELKILGMINYKTKNLLVEQISERIAYYIMLWFKYYRIDKTTYDNLARTSLENNILTDDIHLAAEKSKHILKEKYNIKIISENPLVLSTNIPIHELNEKL